jgi:hypothetical protein
MPSGFVQGLASGLVPELQAISKDRRDRKNKEREPGYQLKNKIFQALQQASQRPAQSVMQSQADQLERSAQPGVPLDLQAALSRTPSGQAYDQTQPAVAFLDAIRQNISGVSDNAVSLREKLTPEEELVDLISMNKKTGQLTNQGQVRKGSVVSQYDDTPKEAEMFRGLIQDILAKPPQVDLQTESERLERSAVPGIPLDLQRALGGTPTGQAFDRADQAKGRIAELANMGVKSVTDSGITMQNPSQASLTPLVFDPATGKYFDSISGEEVTAPVARGTPVRNKMIPLDVQRERSYAQGAGSAEGRLGVEGLAPERSAAIASGKAVLRSVDNLTRLLDADPDLFEKASVPGARMSPDDKVKEAVFWIENIKTNRQFGLGGKVLSANETQRVNATLSSLIRGEKVSRVAWEETANIIRDALSRNEGSYSRSIDQSGREISDRSGSSDDPLGIL